MKYNEGVKYYLLGEWARAKEILELCVKSTPIIGGDPPSRAILNYMNSFGYTVPEVSLECMYVYAPK